MDMTTSGWSGATNKTATWLLWSGAVDDALVALGVSGDWLRSPLQRKRLSLYWASGEPVWMAAETLRAFWKGEQLASLEDKDGRGIIRAAHRGSLNGPA